MAKLLALQLSSGADHCLYKRHNTSRSRSLAVHAAMQQRDKAALNAATVQQQLAAASLQLLSVTAAMCIESSCCSCVGVLVVIIPPSVVIATATATYILMQYLSKHGIMPCSGVILALNETCIAPL